MRAVMLRNVETHEARDLVIACVFVAIGHDLNTAGASRSEAATVLSLEDL